MTIARVNKKKSAVPPNGIIALLLLSFAGVHRNNGCWAFSPKPTLSAAYLEIAERSNALPRWPDSKQLCDDCLVYQEDTQSYRLPTFPDGNGPLGVFGFLHGNSQAKSIMTACDDVLDEFCNDIRANVLLLNTEHDQQLSAAAMDHWILRSPPTSHHISVAILQENPSFLLDPTDLEKWKPVSNATIQTLALLLEQEHLSGGSPPPRIKLDQLLWTPDGALIAGFVDDNDDDTDEIEDVDNAGFDRLRQSSRTIARDVLGDILTTRPKNLIHATVGRVIGLPPGASDAQYQALAELARHYNEEVLPATVEKIQQECGGSFELQDLSLARNTVWMLHEYAEYATWRTGNN